MKVLIADDEMVSRHKLQSLLAKWGHDVVSAEDGNAAFELLRAPDAPRVVLLDWMMPGMNGVDVCRAVRTERPEPYTYMLLLTGQITQAFLSRFEPGEASKHLVRTR